MNKTLKVIFTLIGIALLVALIWYTRTILAYILIASVITLLGDPLVELLGKVKLFKKYKLPASIKALLVLLLIFLVIGGFISVFIPVVIQEANIISSIKVSQITTSLEEPLNAVQDWMAKYKLKVPQGSDEAGYWEEKLVGLINTSTVTDILNTIVGLLGNIFVALFSIVFISFFFLKDKGLLSNIVLTLTPDKELSKVRNVMINAKKLLTRYFLGVLIQVTLITTLVTIGLSIVGIKNAIVIGFFAGLINVIPYVGPLIGAAFGLIIGISTNLHLDFYDSTISLMIKIAGIFLIVQLLDNMVFQPFIFSNSVSAHPLEIFLVIMVAGTLAGITGMILAIPVYTIVRIIAKEFLSEYKVVKSLTGHI